MASSSDGSSNGKFTQVLGPSLVARVGPRQECITCGGPLDAGGKCTRWLALRQVALGNEPGERNAAQRSSPVLVASNGLTGLRTGTAREPMLIAGYDDVWGGGDGGLLGPIIGGIIAGAGWAGSQLADLLQQAIEGAIEEVNRQRYARLWRVVGQSEMQSIWNSNYQVYGVSPKSTEKRFWLSQAQAVDYEHVYARTEQGRGRATFLTSILLKVQHLPQMHWGRVTDTPILGGIYCSVSLESPAMQQAFPWWYERRIYFHGQLRDWDMNQVGRAPRPTTPTAPATTV